MCVLFIVFEGGGCDYFCLGVRHSGEKLGLLVTSNIVTILFIRSIKKK